MNPANQERIDKFLHNSYIKSQPRAELENMYASFLLDSAETDTYIREKCAGILNDFEINGDSYGVPAIEDLFDKLVEKYNKEICDFERVIDNKNNKNSDLEYKIEKLSNKIKDLQAHQE